MDLKLIIHILIFLIISWFNTQSANKKIKINNVGSTHKAINDYKPSW